MHCTGTYHSRVSLGLSHLHGPYTHADQGPLAPGATAPTPTLTNGLQRLVVRNQGQEVVLQPDQEVVLQPNQGVVLQPDQEVIFLPDQEEVLLPDQEVVFLPDHEQVLLLDQEVVLFLDQEQVQDLDQPARIIVLPWSTLHVIFSTGFYTKGNEFTVNKLDYVADN